MEIIEVEEKEIEAPVASTNGCTSSFKLEDHPWPPQPTQCPSPGWKMFLAASLAVGIQFGWASQLFLLASYVPSMYYLSKACTIILWLFGPIFGLIFQPIIGFYSDHSTFIVAGVGLEIFATDFCYLSYNTKGPNNQIVAPNFGYLMIGFIILDAGNNLLQVTCRALIGDVAAGNHAKAHLGNAAFSFFMAVDNITGFSIATYRHLYLIFPFSQNATCDFNCTNLKSCKIISIALLISLTSLVLSFIDEKTFFPAILQDGSQVTHVLPPFLGLC